MKICEKTPDELFTQAMEGIQSCMGRNEKARQSEMAVAEMHRRLKLSAEVHREIFVMGREDAKVV